MSDLPGTAVCETCQAITPSEGADAHAQWHGDVVQQAVKAAKADRDRETRRATQIGRTP